MVEIVFGFDFGVKRIGIAMGNTLTGQAQPLSVIKAIDNANCTRRSSRGRPARMSLSNTKTQ